jgi:hypothetical protein
MLLKFSNITYRHSFESSSGLELVRQIKEKICYVALDFEKEQHDAQCSSSYVRPYQLPDGYGIQLSKLEPIVSV